MTARPNRPLRCNYCLLSHHRLRKARYKSINRISVKCLRLQTQIQLKMNWGLYIQSSDDFHLTWWKTFLKSSRGVVGFRVDFLARVCLLLVNIGIFTRYILRVPLRVPSWWQCCKVLWLWKVIMKTYCAINIGIFVKYITSIELINVV